MISIYHGNHPFRTDQSATMYFFIFLISFTVASASAISNTTQDCKCVPGDSCWPSTSDFSALNDTLSGHLIQAIPPASVCYQSEPNYDEAACNQILSSWFSSDFHAADPISIGWPWWARNPCPPIFPNGTSVTLDPDAEKKGCSIGAYPVYSVNATTEEHVVETVKWAAEKNIRLVIKSTGHSFQGRSTGFGSIVIWTHHMRGFEWHDSFKGEQCASNASVTAATIAAGERVRDIYTAADKHNSVIVGGSEQAVGVMGWFTGGGHGPLSSTYGFGVDNVLEFRIVTPDGKIVTANPCLNPDLFWAVRGGGGSTFGVVTSVTMRAYPSPRVTRHSFALSLLSLDNETLFWDLVAEVFSELPRQKQGGMQGYASLVPPVPGANPFNGPNDPPTWALMWSHNAYDKPNGTVESLVAPMLEKLDPYNGSAIFYLSEVRQYPNFFTAWDTTGTQNVAISGMNIASRLLTAESLTRDKKQLARLLQKAAARSPDGSYALIQSHLVANDRHELADQVSATAAWRDAVVSFLVIEGFKDSSTFEEARPVLDRLTYERLAALKSLAPESGAYFNEADPFDPNWQYEYWGKNYERLSQIKKSYDPQGLLWCLSCVGSEEWTANPSGQLCKASTKQEGQILLA
ncbi:FAD-binding domain-containing protein [Aaosphaeria arxii CBS 175.79]|uniref:FAD-binding domain-containing protein n=1 Tax=Aaosphaeria arxii CBS 175.79 TaxID=1450172 RepID=A0A6A5XSR0_9PLEO|nr:FAD-binding domain-containing protein [Aaosphaeria arxii CBS 175.79]KAF2016338.1 FAD-binding domain-containing protein [Aaosphaeria arxii CBS 175.79]